METSSLDVQDIAFYSPKFWEDVGQMLQRLTRFQFSRFFIDEFGVSKEHAEMLASRASFLIDNIEESL